MHFAIYWYNSLSFLSSIWPCWGVGVIESIDVDEFICWFSKDLSTSFQLPLEVHGRL